MSGSSAKWFDLSDFGSKLERRSTDGMGRFKIVLEVPSARLEPLIPDDPTRTVRDDLEDMGWMMEATGTDRYLLTNYATMNKKSEIVAALRPFFAAEEIEASHVSVHALSQGEVVQGLQARQLITQSELAQDIDGVSENDFTRISESVKKAQDLQAERLKRQTNVLFAGHGREVFNHLTDTIMERFGWDEAEASIMARSGMLDAKKPSSTLGVWMTSLASAIIEKDQTSLETWTDQVIGKVIYSHSDPEELRVALNEGSLLRNLRSIYETNPTGDHPIVSVRDANLYYQDGLSPEIMDAVEVGVPVGEAFSYYKDRLPFMVVRDSSVPSRLLAQSMAAVDKALDVIAAELELPRDQLVPKQKVLPVRFSYDATSAADTGLGNVRRLVSKADADTDAEAEAKDDDRAALTMNISVTKGRSFIHELGHLVDFGNGLSDEERHAILSKSGVLADAKATVDRQYPSGGTYAEYLLQEDEIFARTFEAHIVNSVRARGDHNLRALGGLHTNNGFDLAAPFGNLERSSAFMNELKDTLAMRRENRHEASRKAEAGAEANAGVSYATHGMG